LVEFHGTDLFDCAMRGMMHPREKTSQEKFPKPVARKKGADFVTEGKTSQLENS
jgi:hypothetical protein